MLTAAFNTIAFVYRTLLENDGLVVFWNLR